MQLYALDFKDQVTHAGSAIRQTDYICFECRQIVRVRGGPHRRRHYYHLDPTPSCRQNGKGPEHLEVQFYLQRLLSQEDTRIEYPFSSINRIADVAWLPRKIVFEIQCSPISQEEILARNRDYAKIGWRVVWILHDRRYNQFRLSGAELVLCTSPHFFSNIDAQGEGMIYDQFDICQNGIRRAKLPPLPLDFCKIFDCEHFAHSKLNYLSLIEKRKKNWGVAFEGDLISLHVNDPSSKYLQKALDLEMKFGETLHSSLPRRCIRKLWECFILNPYQIFFRFLLEKMCR